MKSFVTPLVSVAVALFLWATPAHATRYVLMADGDLVDQAPLIAEVLVLSVDRSAGPVEPMTEYQLALERLIKGDVTGSELLVRVRGGQLADGTGLHIYGAPRFVKGERALLFLKPWGDGTYGVVHLMLGAFRIVELDGQEVAVRQLAEAQEVDLPGFARGRDGSRSLDRFRVWLADRASGLARPADYFVASAPPGKFTIVTGPSGNKIRWQVFDSGGDVGFRAHEDGQPGLASGGFTEFQAAIAAWNSDPSTPIDIRYDGTTTASGGLMTFDGVNAILFADAAHFVEPFNCSTGGVIAVAGPWFSGTHEHNGETFDTVIGGDIVTNTGLDCISIGQPWIAQNRRAEEIFAHELGHALALGHSCGDASSPSCGSSSVLNGALMRTLLHGDNRGAALNSDDRAGILFLYGQDLIFADGFESGDTTAW